MTLQEQLKDVTKAAVMTDSQDLGGLVSLQERLESIAKSLDQQELDTLAETAERTTKLVEQIILREAQNAETAFELVKRAVGYLQDAVEADERGLPASTVGPSPFEDGGAGTKKAEAADRDLILAWVSSCESVLADLESAIVQVEGQSEEQRGELVGEVRRKFHTLKGECGVLSLHMPGKLCHEAESAIDRCVATKAKLPTDSLLEVVDYFKGLAAKLSEDTTAEAPGVDALLKLFAEDAPGAATAPAAAEKAGESSGRTEAEQIAAGVCSDEPVVFGADMGMDENLSEFITEAREHIASSESALLKLEQEPKNTELINTVFRAFHTIKGVAGFMNLKPIVTLAHAAEFLLDGARNGRVHLDSRYLDLVLASGDMLSQLIGLLEGQTAPKQGRLNQLVNALQRAANGEAPGPALPTPKPSPVVNLDSSGNVVSMAAIAGTAPTAEMAGTAAMKERNMRPVEEPSVAASANAGQGAASQSPAGTAQTAKRADQSVKVSTQRMDSLVNLVGELVIAHQMVVQDVDGKDSSDQREMRNLAMVGKIIRDLQEVSMSLRMVTLKGTFQKMTRLVRDVSAKARKDIQFHTEGEDVELDRNVVEEIADPLVHMIRNACDHGIEPAADREKAGKPATGNLLLRAFHSGGSIVIEIKDDGRGLNRDKILKKAIEKGIFSPDRALEEISDADAYNLVFLPGFSTADKVTDISGRGVGMDVVRRNIEALRGKVEIRSTPGQGATFQMRLPLTMAIIDGMIVRVGSHRYVVPTLNIVQMFRPGAGQIHTVVGKGEMAKVRESLLPIYRLNDVLKLGVGKTSPVDALLIVLESNHTRCCLMVDDIIGQQQVVIKNLGRSGKAIRGVSGGAILGDGRVALILDVGGIISKSTSNT